MKSSQTDNERKNNSCNDKQTTKTSSKILSHHFFLRSKEEEVKKNTTVEQPFTNKGFQFIQSMIERTMNEVISKQLQPYLEPVDNSIHSSDSQLTADTSLIPFYNGSFCQLSNDDLIRSIKESETYIQCKDEMKKLINEFMEKNKDLDGSTINEDASVTLENFKYYLLKDGNEYEYNKIINASNIFTYIIREIGYCLIPHSNYYSTKSNNLEKQLRSLRECSKDKEFLEFDEDVISPFFPKHKILIRSSYNTVFKYIIKKYEKEDKQCNCLIRGNPGIGKTVFAYYLIHKFRNEKSTKNVPITYIYRSKGEKSIHVYKMNNTDVKYVGNIIDINLSENHSIVISDSCDISDLYTHVDICICISSPDEEQYKEFKKRMNPKLFYFDYWNSKELNKWYKYCINGNESIKDECIRLYGRNPRMLFQCQNHEERLKEFTCIIKRAIEKYDAKLIYFGEYINSNSCNNFSHSIFKYVIHKDEEGLPTIIENEMEFISDSIEESCKHLLGIQIDENEFLKLLNLYEKETTATLRGIYYQSLIHYVMKYHSSEILIKAQNSKLVKKIFYFNFPKSTLPDFYLNPLPNSIDKSIYYDLRSCSRFPDVDAFGNEWLIQITTSESHTYNPFVPALCECLKCKNGFLVIYDGSHEKPPEMSENKTASIKSFPNYVKETLIKVLNVKDVIDDKHLVKRSLKKRYTYTKDDIYFCIIGSKEFKSVKGNIMRRMSMNPPFPTLSQQQSLCDVDDEDNENNAEDDEQAGESKKNKNEDEVDDEEILHPKKV